MGDKVCNQNRLEAGAVQGGNFVESVLHNPVFHIHESGREKFLQNYQKIKVIGRGSFGDAWLVKPKNVNSVDEFIMKEIPYCNKDANAENVEIVILKQLSHENIVQYIQHFLEESKILIVMEFCRGGDLMHTPPVHPSHHTCSV